VACLSLAAKMEERKVPALSQYSVDGYNSEGNVIKKLELLVLNTLEWEMGSITPFEFLHYFITKFFGDSKPPTDLFSRAIELISSILKGKLVLSRLIPIRVLHLFIHLSYLICRD